MPLILEQEKLAYYPMHKCANSTVKQMIYEIETGAPFGASRGTEIHKHYPKATSRFRPMPDGDAKAYFKFAVVRDPISRFVSGYKWLVHSQDIYARDKTAARLKEQGLSTKPSFSVFVTNLQAYLDARQIARTHLAPLRRFLGRNSDYYDAVYNVSDVDRLATDLSTRFGRPIATVSANTTRGLGVNVRTTAKQKEKIRDLYASDYEDFGAFF